jgi:uncharacterized protein with HEPN domain
LSFRAPDQSLREILQGIDRIQLHVAGMSLNQFRDDIKTIDAVERNLQRISEAAIRLGDQAESLCPGLPWRDIRGIGNWLRHQYDRIDPDTIWYTVTDHLPLLRASVESALQRIDRQ